MFSFWEHTHFKYTQSADSATLLFEFLCNMGDKAADFIAGVLHLQFAAPRFSLSIVARTAFSSINSNCHT